MRSNFLLVSASILSSFLGLACTSAESELRTYSYDIGDPCYHSSDCYTVQVGSAEIEQSRIMPYYAKWTQDVPSGDEWVRSPITFEEKLSFSEDGNWKHVQIMHQGDSVSSIGTRILDRDSLQILSLKLQIENGPPEQPIEAFYDMTGDRFAADVLFADGRKIQGQPRELSMPMFDGQIAGLTLASLPLSEGYTATLPMVIPNLGIYWVEVNVVGKQQRTIEDGSTVEVWEVTANWLNLTDGDIYEPGRNGDGGVYYIAVNPGDGIPPVIEYANNTSVIAWDGNRRNQ